METIYRYNEDRRVLSKYGSALMLGYALLFVVATILCLVLLAEGSNATPLWRCAGALIALAALSIGLGVHMKRVSLFVITISDDSIRVGNQMATWDRIEAVEHRPSKVLAIEFRIRTKDGRRLDVWRGAENVQEIEDIVRSRIAGAGAAGDR